MIARVDGALCAADRRNQGWIFMVCLAIASSGGAEGARTPDPRLAKPVLSQLSYNPSAFVPAPAPGRLIAIVASLRGTYVPLTSLLRQTLAHAPNLEQNPILRGACPAQDFFVRSERPRRPEVRATKVARSVGSRRKAGAGGKGQAGGAR